MYTEIFCTYTVTICNVEALRLSWDIHIQYNIILILLQNIFNNS